MDAVVTPSRLKQGGEGRTRRDAPSTSKAFPASRGSLIESLWRRRLLFGSIFASILALTAIALLVLPVRYRATGSVILAEQEPGQRDNSSVWAQKLGDPADMESQLLVMGSARMLRLAFANPDARDAVVQDCLGAGKGGKLAFLFGPSAAGCEKLRTNDDAVLDYLRTRYTIGNVGRSRVINVSYDSTQPDVAQKLANALVNAFLDDQRASANAGRQQAAKGIWDELARLNAELHEDDAKIEEFRRSKGLERGSLAPVSSERLSSMLAQLAAAEAARAEAEARLKEIIANRDGGSVDAPAALGSRSVADLKQQLATVDVQLAAARSTLGPNHPTLRELDRQHAMLTSRIGAEVDALLAAARKRYESTGALVAQIKKQVDAAKAQAGDARADEASIEAIVRGAEIKRRKYAELYNRASELETERRVLQGNSRLVSLAEVPDQPFFPKRTPFVAAGLTLATLLATAAALLRDRMDETVHDAVSLAPLAEDGICVEFPRLPGEDGAEASADDPMDGAADLRKALRRAKRDEASQGALYELYGALFEDRAPGMRAISVTSAKPREGKSFVAVALARFAAGFGQRVLLVQCDRDRRDLEALFGVEPETGLLALLSDEAILRDVVVKTPVQRLYFLPLEAQEDGVHERIGDRIERLLDVAHSFDLLIFDGPVASALDMRMMARKLDGVIYCARAGASAQKLVEAELRGLRAGGALLVGVALTMAEAPRTPSLSFFAGKRA